MYRIKTKEEFIEMYGSDWRNYLDHYWPESSDDLFGKELTEDQYYDTTINCSNFNKQLINFECTTTNNIPENYNSISSLIRKKKQIILNQDN